MKRNTKKHRMCKNRTSRSHKKRYAGQLQRGFVAAKGLSKAATPLVKKFGTGAFELGIEIGKDQALKFASNPNLYNYNKVSANIKPIGPIARSTI